jgi:GPH family glycoside/pentoside/hexuronide:cation symporter
LSWYVNKVVKLSPHLTGLCLLSGQIADGITTPIVGVLSDKIETRWGKRMPWYYIGFIFVIPCFAGIFAYPPFVNQFEADGITPKNEGFRNAWYITLPALFNIGWASVQISSMSIVNQLSFSGRQRD